MKLRQLAAIPAFITACTIMPVAADAKIYGDTVHVSDHATVLTGNAEGQGGQNIRVLYSREGLAFSDPSAPRFLFLDREGKVALGIGGFVKAIGMYDFDGAVDHPTFCPYDISAPANPAMRQRFGADASHSTLFLKLIAHDSRLGMITAYVQTEFTGNNGGYGLRLKQAYVTVNHFTAGLANSTFVDPESQAPTIEPMGPPGQISCRNMLFRYSWGKTTGFSGAVSIEVPHANYTTVEGQEEPIAQRSPDVPAYVQYAWKSGNHVRFSGLLRQLSYRDLISSRNIKATAWGIQLSAVGDIIGQLGFFGHIAYGRGIADYINDITGKGYDLIPSDREGHLCAPATLSYTAGLSYHFSQRLFASANFSHNRVYRCSTLPSDSYRSGQYFAVNAFYNLTGDFRIGAEYLLGRRTNTDRQSGHANRVEAMVQYSF